MNKCCIGVNGKAKLVKNIYIGVSGTAKKVMTAYIGVNGKAKEVYSNVTRLPAPENILYQDSYLKWGRVDDAYDYTIIDISTGNSISIVKQPENTDEDPQADIDSTMSGKTVCIVARDSHSINGLKSNTIVL